MLVVENDSGSVGQRREGTAAARWTDNTQGEKMGDGKCSGWLATATCLEVQHHSY